MFAMALSLPHILSSSALQSAPAKPATLKPLIQKGNYGQDYLDENDEASDIANQGRLRRTRLWEFDNRLHCSIIGTCLTTSELRHTLEKLLVTGAGSASDHELHTLGTTIACRREDGAKFLQKALDRR